MATIATVRAFTEADVTRAETAYPRIYAETSELLYDPPAWMRAGLMETASGYGRRLNSGLKIQFNGKLYRLYTTIFSNNGSTWFKVKGRTIYVG